MFEVDFCKKQERNLTLKTQVKGTKKKGLCVCVHFAFVILLCFHVLHGSVCVGVLERAWLLDNDRFCCFSVDPAVWDIKCEAVIAFELLLFFVVFFLPWLLIVCKQSKTKINKKRENKTTKKKQKQKQK